MYTRPTSGVPREAPATVPSSTVQSPPRTSSAEPSDRPAATSSATALATPAAASAFMARRCSAVDPPAEAGHVAPVGDRDAALLEESQAARRLDRPVAPAPGRVRTRRRCSARRRSQAGAASSSPTGERLREQLHEPGRGRSIGVERGVVEREGDAERLRVVDQGREQRGQLVDVGTARLGRPDRGHDLGVEHVGVDVDPEPAHVARGDTVENGRCRLGERGRTDGGPVGRDRCPGQVEDARDRERLVAVPLALVAPPDQRDVLTAHERHGTGQPRELRVTAAHGEGEAHARDRPGHRFLRAREIGVPVDIDEPDPAWVGARAATGTTRAQEAAEHDAAIAADDDEEPIVVDPGRDCDQRATGCRWPRPPRSGPCRADARSPRRAAAARRRGPSRPAARSGPGPGASRARDSPPAAHRSHRAAGGRCSMALPGLRRGASGKATRGAAGRVPRARYLAVDRRARYSIGIRTLVAFARPTPVGRAITTRGSASANPWSYAPGVRRALTNVGPPRDPRLRPATPRAFVRLYGTMANATEHAGLLTILNSDDARQASADRPNTTGRHGEGR